MAICRIKSPEQLRHQFPGELGKLIGLDRIPEVKTIREKLSILTENKENVGAWSLKLSQDWMNDFSEHAGVLYIDGHSKIYSCSMTKLPRKYFTSLRLCMRGTNVYYVNDILGQPFFSIEKVIDPGMIDVLNQNIIPRLLREVANSVKFTKIELHPESAPKLLKLQLKTKAEIVEEINNLQNELNEIKAQRKHIAKHIYFRTTSPFFTFPPFLKFTSSIIQE